MKYNISDEKQKKSTLVTKLHWGQKKKKREKKKSRFKSEKKSIINCILKKLKHHSTNKKIPTTSLLAEKTKQNHPKPSILKSCILELKSLQLFNRITIKRTMLQNNLKESFSLNWNSCRETRTAL